EFIAARLHVFVRDGSVPVVFLRLVVPAVPGPLRARRNLWVAVTGAAIERRHQLGAGVGQRRAVFADVADLFGQDHLTAGRGQALEREIVGGRPVALVLLVGHEGAILLRQCLREGCATGRLHLFHLLDVAGAAGDAG